MVKKNELRKNNFYISEEYGVCKYISIENIQNKNYHTFLFDKNKKYYVEDNMLNLFHSYDNVIQSFEPQLDSLVDGKKWRKKKKKTLKEIRETAEKLINLSITRKNIKGYNIMVNQELQNNFIKQYPYELTEGQKQALRSINKDLSTTIASNILLYGSVGSGKSTVMQIIAYNTVVSNGQLVVIAPTELLAKQHFNEFSEIFQSYKNIKIAFVTGRLSKKKKEELKTKVKLNQVNILIGTTSILSQGYDFTNLKLVEIDEEQKFSTRQKELLKTIDPKINQILITGTAIPRTTYMAEAGVLNKVSINTLPQNKKEPTVEVVKQTDNKILEYIIRELDRNGQIYYLINNVGEQEKTKNYLTELLKNNNVKKDITIGIVNGKMAKKESNKIFSGFKKGKYDILICTSIIEVGLTNKAANTIIVERCNYFGLSSLIQLIGRTGRGGIKPYALLMYDNLNEISKKRLKVIQEHTELNNGEIIAKEDLMIRGAGEMFGDKQHGHVSQIGMALYDELLKQEIQKQKKKINL